MQPDPVRRKEQILQTLEVVLSGPLAQEKSQGKFGKYFPKCWRIFRRQRSDSQRTTFTTQSTTNSPQKNHRFTPHLPKPPLKNTSRIRAFSTRHHAHIFF
jgi:hypothetical protein